MATGRHPWRPAHLHFMIRAAGYQTLVTHLFKDPDPYLDSDVVFGVRSSLVGDYVEHPAGVAPDGSAIATPFYTLAHTFILPQSPMSDDTTYYAIWARDRPGMLEERKRVRAAHRARLVEGAPGVRVVLGGPTLDDAGDMTGSLLVIEAADIEQVRAFVAGDPYVQADVYGHRAFRPDPSLAVGHRPPVAQIES